MNLDQFYTKPGVAAECFQYLSFVLAEMRIPKDKVFFVEPSAGEGAFLDLFPDHRRIGIDLDPQRPGICQGNFLAWKFPLATSPRLVIVCGNPPFGSRGDMAVKFFNKAASFAGTIAFIAPMCFAKYRVQKRLDSRFQLALSRRLPRKSFYEPVAAGRVTDRIVNAIFQVWTRAGSPAQDLREMSPTPFRHKDFEMRQYNNTKHTMSAFDSPFDFAVPAQGFQDYTRRETRLEACEKSKQWMLFKSGSPEVRDNLYKMDFERLAHENGTVIPGFRKNDVVREYKRVYESGHGS